MSYSLTFEQGLIRVVMSGALTGDDLVRLADELSSHEDGAAPDRVTDMTALTGIDVGFDEIFALARRRRASELANPVRSALVAATPLQHGFARMYQTLNDHPQITLRIFPDMAAALAWLGED